MLKAIVDAFTFDRPRSERPGTRSMRCSVYAAHVYTQQQGTSPADIRGDETTDRSTGLPGEAEHDFTTIYTLMIETER
jgi:hypothetical protein